MSRQTKRLTVSEIKSVKSTTKEFALNDGGGLQLRVRTSGTKSFSFRYKSLVTGKMTKIALGIYPAMSLKNARAIAFDYQQLLAQKTDPKTHLEKQKEIQQQEQIFTLQFVSTEWFEVKKHDITQDYANDVWRSLELHIFPQIGNVLIKDISAPKVIEVLKPIEARGSLETVKRVCQRLNEIMTYAVNTGMIGSNPIARVNVAFKSPRKQHMKSIQPKELPELMRAISMASIHKTTRCLLEFQLHTIARPGEASGAQWDEIDVKNNLWVIPATRMKKKRIHQVPLSPHMLELLKYTRSITPKSDYIFPSITNPKLPMNSQTANMALKRMGFAGRLVSHGLRSLASTTLNDEGFNGDVIEAALAHIDPNSTRSAYNRATYLDRRREMMNWWSTHIEKNSIGTLSVLNKDCD